MSVLKRWKLGSLTCPGTSAARGGEPLVMFGLFRVGGFCAGVRMLPFPWGNGLFQVSSLFAKSSLMKGYDFVIQGFSNAAAGLTGWPDDSYGKRDYKTGLPPSGGTPATFFTIG